MTDHFHTRKDELAVFWIPADTDIPMELKCIENKWQAMASLIGGHVTTVPHSLLAIPDLPCGCYLDLMVLEEAGLMEGVEPNIRASILAPKVELLFGDAFVIATGPVPDQEGAIDIDSWGLPEAMKLWEGPGSPLPDMPQM